MEIDTHNYRPYDSKPKRRSQLFKRSLSGVPGVRERGAGSEHTGPREKHGIRRVRKKYQKLSRPETERPEVLGDTLLVADDLASRDDPPTPPLRKY